MVDYVKLFRAEEKIGGRFELAALLQKRAVQLMRGDQPLVESKGTNWIEIALEEILADKVCLVPFEGGQPSVPEDDGKQEDPDEDGPPSGRKRNAASKT